jgi:hypothetical protein
MKYSFVQQCLDLLKREDIKNEFKMLLKPVIDFILYEINPYIYIIVVLVFIIFIMILAILIILVLLIRNKNNVNYLFSNENIV